MRFVKQQRSACVVTIGEFAISEAANENSFWKWVLGSSPPFENACYMRGLRERIVADAALPVDEKFRLVDSCNVFLDLFQAIYVDGDESKAESLAPRINRHVPELMARCPLKFR